VIGLERRAGLRVGIALTEAMAISYLACWSGRLHDMPTALTPSSLRFLESAETIVVDVVFDG
jgi:hypothetical protein